MAKRPVSLTLKGFGYRRSDPVSSLFGSISRSGSCLRYLLIRLTCLLTDPFCRFHFRSSVGGFLTWYPSWLSSNRFSNRCGVFGPPFWLRLRIFSTVSSNRYSNRCGVFGPRLWLRRRFFSTVVFGYLLESLRSFWISVLLPLRLFLTAHLRFLRSVASCLLTDCVGHLTA